MRRSVLPLLFFVAVAAACSRSSPVTTVFVPPQPPAVGSTPVAKKEEAPKTKTPAEPPIVAEPDGPAAPTVRPIDPKTKLEGGGLLLGETNDHAWLIYDNATVVIDKSTGCAIESYPSPAALEEQRQVSRKKIPPTPEEVIARADVLEGIRFFVGLGRRFKGQHQPYAMDTTWSPNGHHIVVDVMKNGLYRSSDGGQSFKRLDETEESWTYPKYGGDRLRTSRPKMSPDGKFLVYERCAATCEYVSLALDESRKPLPLTSGNTFFLKFNPADASVYFWRSTHEVCLDQFDLKTAKKVKSFCTPLPAQVVGPWPAQHWVDVSPNGHYGIVKWEEHRPNLAGVLGLTYIVTLVDLTNGQTVRTIQDVSGEVDDDGNMVVQSMSEGGGDHTYYYPKFGAKKLLGNHSLLSYTNKVAMLHVWHKSTTLGASKCDLVKMVKP